LRAGTCSECGPYDAVMGEWYVPQVKISDNNLSTYSSFWIGIDGDGLSDLWQAGTEQVSAPVIKGAILAGVGRSQ
jgi:hypothetical protein